MKSDMGKLFIGGISWDTDEERLREYFKKYGEVVEAVIMRDRVTGCARGFGFVIFADPAVAEMVIMDKHMIDGRTVEAKKAVPREDHHILNRSTLIPHGSPVHGNTKKIFVGGLGFTVTESDFKNYFDQFGTITDVVVMYDHNNQRPRGFGFITYDSEEAVDRVLHKTFHELNGKMVEVKRAVPKEQSQMPNRSPLIGFSQVLSRVGKFVSNYDQGYDLLSLGGSGVDMDGRFSPFACNGFFNTTGYRTGWNAESEISESYSGSSNFVNGLGYGRVMSPNFSGNANRYGTPIGYSIGSGRSDSVLSSPARNIWGNGGLSDASNSSDLSGYLDSGGGSFGVSFGNNGSNWNPSHLSATGGVSASSLLGGNASYLNGDDDYGLGGGYRRNSSSLTAPTPSFAGPTNTYDGPFGDFYHRGSTYSDSVWQSATPDIDGCGLFHYGLGNISSDVTTKSGKEYARNYNVTNRQSNRGIAA